MAAAIAKSLKAVGFAYVSLDLEGYRQGSLERDATEVCRNIICANLRTYHSGGPDEMYQAHTISMTKLSDAALCLTTLLRS